MAQSHTVRTRRTRSDRTRSGGSFVYRAWESTMEADEFARQAVGLHQRLVRAVAAYCGNRTLAEESAQEALVRAWERVDAGQALASLEAWTMRVALNWATSQLRRSGAERRAMDKLASARSGAAPAAGAGADESVGIALADEVALAVLGLSDRQRQVVVLHYLEDLDVATVAAVTERSVGATKNALHHARKALARELGSAPSELEEPS